MNINRKGYTLIELMIIIAIIGVLATVSVPGYTKYLNRARYAEMFADAQNLEQMVSEYIQTTGTTDCSNIPLNVSNSQSPNTPNVQVAVIDTAADYTPGGCRIAVGGAFGPLNGGGGGPVSEFVFIYAIPTINSDNSIVWTLYSDGSPDAPSYLPVYANQ